MTDTTISTTIGAAQTITGGNRLIITSGGTLNPGGPAITFGLAGGGTLELRNSGSILPTSGRAFDTSGTPGVATDILITNFAGGVVTGKSDIMRLQKSLAGGDFTLDNAGTMTALSGRGFNIQEYVGGGHYSFKNESGATIQSTDDTIRLTTASAGDPVSNNPVFTGTLTIENNGTLKSVGVGSGQVLDLADINATSLGHVSVLNRGVIESGDADTIRGSRFAEIDNYGRIQSLNANAASSGNDAIDFQSNDGGVVNNHQTGQIIGARHGITGDEPITITNDGTITGQGGSGINLDTASTATAVITNERHGVITGMAAGAVDGDGIDVDGLVTIVNEGTIRSVGHSTVGAPPPLAEAITIGGGSIDNRGGGLIVSDERAITVDDSNGGNAFAATTITNAGTITGGNGEAIVIIGTFADTIDNHGTINGSVSTGDGADLVINAKLINGALDTGAGDDRIVQVGAAVFGSIDGGAGTDTLAAGANNTAIAFAGFTGIEAIDGAGFANVTVVGTAGADVMDFSGLTLTGIAAIKGGAGDDVITGSSGADTIWGETGNDTLIGGAGDDIFLFKNSTAANGLDSIFGGDGHDTLLAQAANTLFAYAFIDGIEAIDGHGFANVMIAGSAGADKLDFSAITLTDIAMIRGGAGDDVITGSSGSDTIWGETGNDTIYGGDGDDVILFKNNAAANGLDAIFGGNGHDTLVAQAAGTLIGYTLIDGIEAIDGHGFANVAIVGTAGADTLDFSAITLTDIAMIRGDAGDDMITGSQGSDTIWGGAGNDTLYGGQGDDIFLFRNSAAANGLDAIYGGEGHDTLLAQAANTQIGFASIDGIEAIDGNGFANVTIVGTAANDSMDLTGITTSGIAAIDMGAGNDTLVGSDSGDVIRGGAGADDLTGGQGADSFAYRALSDSRGTTIDTIHDFTQGADKIDLSAIDANTAAAGDQAFAFIGTDAFHHVAGELRFENAGGMTSLFADVNGDGKVDFEVHLTGNLTLLATDFVL